MPDVKYDQTVTLRIHHSKKKVRGKLYTQCPRGCGEYLTDEELKIHDCNSSKETELGARHKERERRKAEAFAVVSELFNKPKPLKPFQSNTAPLKDPKPHERKRVKPETTSTPKSKRGRKLKEFLGL